MQRNIGNGNPKVYLVEEGKLQYPIRNMETGRIETKILVRGVDVDDVTFDCLYECYHAEQLSDRYFEEHLDYVSEMKKAKYEAGDDGVTQEPIEGIADERADICNQIFAKASEEPEIVKIFMERVFPKLTDAQKNLIYPHYGERKTLEEIRMEEAAETGREVTHQAMSNRIKKIQNRVKTLMPEFLPIKE